MPTLTDDELIALDAVALEMSLRKFARGAWEHIEGDRSSFTPGWHLDCICEHLEAVSHGQIRRLLINIPPRMTKSLLVSVFWPAWEWASRPRTRWLCTSYNRDLALRDAVNMRLLTTSFWYQERWGHVWKYQDDANQKGRFINSKRGHRFSTGTLAQILGEGGDILVSDDPHSVQERESKAALQATIKWFHEGFLTRFNNQKKGRCVVVGQRVNAEDLSNELRNDPHWTSLVLPNEYDPKRRCVTVIGFADPREVGCQTKYHATYEIGQGEGALLCPDRFGAEETAFAKSPSGLGSVAYSAQFQQDPVPPGGAFFKGKHFSRYSRNGVYIKLESHLKMESLVIHQDQLALFMTADTASTEKTSADPTAICLWGITADGKLLLLDFDHGKIEVPEVRRRIRAMAMKWNCRLVAIEYANTGIGVVQDLRQCPDFAVIAVTPTMDVQKVPGVVVKITDKIGRASLAQIQFEAGDIYLPRPVDCEWISTPVESELLAFSTEMTHAHDDIVDCFGYAAIMRLKDVYHSARLAIGNSDTANFRPEAYR